MKDQLRATIENDTLGRLDVRKVDAIDGHVVVHGSAESYYAVQLAIKISRTFLETRVGLRSIRLELGIGRRRLNLILS